jgi:dimeric dUTPase (all-alpha-NTP-PPase superfamily)
MTTLQLVLDKQEEFQTKFGYNKNEIDLEGRVALIHTHSQFLMEETFEMLRELPFHKPWKDYSKMSTQEIDDAMKLAKKEWIDMLHFVANIAVFLGFTEEEIRKEYLEKHGINHKRQEDPSLGYITA